MSNINDLAKWLNSIKRNLPISELTKIQAAYPSIRAAEISAIQQSSQVYNALYSIRSNELQWNSLTSAASKAAVAFKSVSPQIIALQPAFAELQALSARWEAASKSYGIAIHAKSPDENSESIELDDDLFEQVSGAVDAIIPDENPQKPEILGKVKHQFTFEQLMALISLLLTIANFIFEIYSSNENSKQDKQSTQDRPAIEQSVDKSIEDIDNSQKDLLIAVQSIADSTQRLTEIAEDRGLLIESSEDISFETGEAKT